MEELVGAGHRAGRLSSWFLEVAGSVSRVEESLALA